MAAEVRTRIAPSPTGFLHLGTARTAIFSWAYARHFGGKFVLRIEDTDVARSTPEAVDAIVDGMAWLGLDADEGPFFQMQRLDRYREAIDGMLAAGTAYRCWCTPAELDAMRDAQRARGEKPHYDRRWRPEPGKTLPPVPDGVEPVIRFANPVDGEVTWDDLVKGPITIANHEIDDLIIVRADGVPTYNFAVVVDDWDMRISHVFRGDEHVNNTPWQINLFHALGAPLPRFGHVPVILGDDGQKLSKRRGAVSVLAYRDDGYLPEAMVNYLARLGWSHGDEELFTREQLVEWFDTRHLVKSAAHWDPKKLAWVNNHYIKAANDERLATLLMPLMRDARRRAGPGAPRVGDRVDEGSLRHAGRARGRRDAVLSRRRRRRCAARVERADLGPARVADLRRSRGAGRVGPRGDRCIVEGRARRARAEDAAARGAAARPRRRDARRRRRSMRRSNCSDGTGWFARCAKDCEGWARSLGHASRELASPAGFEPAYLP